MAKFKQDVKKICQRNEFYCEESVGPYLDPDEISYLFDELSGLAKTLSPLGYFSDYIGWSVSLGDSFLESWTELSKEFSDALCIPRFPEQGVAFDKKGFFGSIVGSGIDVIRPVPEVEELTYDENGMPNLPPEWPLIDNEWVDAVKIGRAYIDFHFNVPSWEKQTPLLFMKVQKTVKAFLLNLFAGDREGIFSRHTSLEYSFDITSIEIEDNLDIPKNMRTMFDLAKKNKSELRKF